MLSQCGLVITLKYQPVHAEPESPWIPDSEPTSLSQLELFSAVEWLQLAKFLNLSDRRNEVLKRVLRGDSDQQISQELGISQPTVRTHLQRLFQQFGVSSRTTLVVAVFRIFREQRGFSG